MSLGSGLGRRLQRLLSSLFRDPRLTSDHLLIAADACDEAERELRLADVAEQAPRTDAEFSADEVRVCSSHLRAIASRYGDAPLPREVGSMRLPIEEMPVAAIACLPPATLVQQARAIVGEMLASLEAPLTDCERLTMSWRLRGALLALGIAHDEVEALQRPFMPLGRAAGRAAGRAELHLVGDEEGA